MRPVRVAFTLLVLGSLGLGASTLEGQAPIRPSPPLIKYGKWVALGTSVAFGLLAQAEHADADRAYNALNNYCLDDGTRCDTGPNGHYLDPVSEGYYQTSLTHDRRAGHWLFGGEALFLSAAAGFIWELTRPSGPPGNIPFAPLVEQHQDRLEIGGSVRF
ncbi:MAG: hypothetical protein ACREOE_16070 [Gemmatimonadales bacterium]